MRLSANEEDPGYKPELFNANIKLDGKIIDSVITADEEEGFVLAYVKDSNGKYEIDEEKQTLVQKRLEGKVEIILDGRTD